MKLVNRTIYFGLLLVCFLTLPSNVYCQNKPEPIKIIFDCDLGDDIDDAYALSLLLASPEFEILGVIMDYGNTPERGRMALKLLDEVGRNDISVLIGRKTNDEYSPQYYWSKGFDKIKPSTKSSSEFIVSMLEKYPNEVVLLTVGPLPNMIDLLKDNPKILSKAKHVYSMFGSFYMGYDKSLTPSNEWNVRADLDAAKAFVHAEKKITYIPLDVTTFVKITKDNRELLLMRQTALTNFISGLYPLWRFMPYAKEDPTVYDAVAVGMILWPELFSTRPGYVEVIGNGYTVIDENRAPNSEIAISINENEFIKRMMERLLKQNLHNGN